MSPWNFSVCCKYIKIDWTIYEHRPDTLENLYFGGGEKYSPGSREKIPPLGKFFGEVLIYQGLESQWLLSRVNECVAEAVFTFEPKTKMYMLLE